MVAMLLFSCAPMEREDVLIIGHGGLGMGASVPMNSEAALVGGLALGADGVELDVQLTADSVLVAYHAQDLSELTPCTGLINAKLWSELTSCTLRGEDGLPVPIIRLDSALAHLSRDHPTASYTLDIKLFAAGDWWSYLDVFSQRLRALHAQQGLHGRLVVECQVVEFLDLVGRVDANLPLFLYATDAEEGIRTVKEKGYTGITMDHGRMDAASVSEAKEAGVTVALFGVGGWWSHRRAMAKRPDRLQTDSPGAFRGR